MIWREPQRRMPYVRMNMADRKRQLLDAAIPLAEKYGFEHVSRGMIAGHVGCAASLISAYWNSPALETAIMEEAVAQENLAIVAQGLTARHPAALAAPITLRRTAAKHLIEEDSDADLV